ncbi:TPA: hypothetical protein RQK38_000515 [Vibrio vulnificus]|nr:hypothetical protein [Vibrio vulnificus]
MRQRPEPIKIDFNRTETDYIKSKSNGESVQRTIKNIIAELMKIEQERDTPSEVKNNAKKTN